MAIQEFTGTTSTMLKVCRADAEYLGAEDLPEDGTPICVMIDKVVAITGDGKEIVAGRKLKDKETLYALTLKAPNGQSLKKKMICKKTKIKTLESLYGTQVDGWHGKPVWVVRGQTTVAGKPTACITIQVRSDMPKQSKKPPAPQTEETQPQMGDAAEGGAE